MKATITARRFFWTHAINVAAIAIHITLLLQAVKPNSLAAVVFMLIVAAPPAIMSASAVFLSRTDAPRGFTLSLSAIYLAFGAWAYYDAMYVHPDPQNGLVFILVPILGLIVAFIVVAITFVVFQSSKSPGTPKHDA